MAGSRKTTEYWISKHGGIGVWSQAYDDDGELVSEIGSELPKGAKKATIGALVDHVATELIEAKRAFEQNELQRRDQSLVEADRRSDHVAEFVSAGVSEATAEAVVPQALIYTPRAYSIPTGLEQHLKDSYGFTDGNVASVMSALDD